MVSGFYDIFKRNEREIPVWVGGGEGPHTAKARIIELCQTGQYLVFHSRTGRMITAGTLVSSSEHRAPERQSKDLAKRLSDSEMYSSID
jgi:hypothetical protein